MASTIPQRSSRPPLTSAPPTGPLPALPIPRSRKPLPDIPDQTESRPTTSGSTVASSTTATKIHTRSVTTSGLPTLKPSKISSSPAVPTLNTTTNDATASSSPPSVSPASPSAIPTPGKTLRKTTSIGQFPLPPKVATQQRVNSLPPSPLSTTNSTTDVNGLLKEKAKRDGSSTNQRSSESAVRKPRTRASGYGVRPRASNASLYGSTSSPSLLNGTGDKNLVASPDGLRISDTSLSSRAHSQSTRSSSVNGSYHTDGTSLDDEELHHEGGGMAQRGRRKSQETLTDKRRSSAHHGKDSKGNVIVSVRVRPDASAGGGADDNGTSKAAAAQQTEGEWLVDGRRSLISYRGREGGEYRYDNVFSPHDHNARVYDHAAKRLVRRVMEGYHGTVFAYGMTGTGKTFSMQGTKDSPGVIPSSVSDIFAYIRENPRREFLLRVSYLEIYNEKIFDLLSPITPGQPGQEEIKLREDSKRGVYATPLKEEIVQSPTQLLRVIARGDAARRTAGTQFNARSSRSHAVVQIVVESRERSTHGAFSEKETEKHAALRGGVLVSTLSLIDLAGSERAADNKERRTEGAHINKSLLTLGTVIAKLSGDDEKDKADKDDGASKTTDTGPSKEKCLKHLPYRDSKLTRLLQPALSGNSLVSILCTIQLSSANTSAASAGLHTGETLGTLKFASRAKNNIVSHAKRNESHAHAGDPGSRALLDRYRIEIQELRTKLEEQQSKAKSAEEAESSHNDDDNDDEHDAELERELERQERLRREEQMVDMDLARQALSERIDHLNRLILSSKSAGVNSGGIGSSGSALRFARPASSSTLLYGGGGGCSVGGGGGSSSGNSRLSAASMIEFGRPVSVRSIGRDSQFSRATSPSRFGRESTGTATTTREARRPSLARSVSTGSTTPGGGGVQSPPLPSDDTILPTTNDNEASAVAVDAAVVDVENEADDDPSTTALTSEASLAQQIRMLQADLADKNRYIDTLHQRLNQARRTSRSRVSLQFAPRGASFPHDDGVAGSNAGSATAGNGGSGATHQHLERLLSERDREIEDLRAKLDDQVRMVNALRSAARKTALSDLQQQSQRSRRSLPGVGENYVSSSDDTAMTEKVVSSASGATVGAGAAVTTTSARASRESRASLRNSQQQQNRLANGGTNGTTITSTTNTASSSPSTTNSSSTSTSSSQQQARQANRSESNASRSSPTTIPTNTTTSPGATAAEVTAGAAAAAAQAAQVANRPPYNRLPPTPLSPIALLSPSAEEEEGGSSEFSDFPGVPGSKGYSSHYPHQNQNQHQSQNHAIDSSNPTSPTKSSQGGSTTAVGGKRVSQQHRRRSVDEMTQLLDQMIQDKVESGQVLRGMHGSLRIAPNASTAGRGTGRDERSAAASAAATAATAASAEPWGGGGEGAIGLEIMKRGGAGGNGVDSAIIDGPSGAPPSSPPPPLPTSASAPSVTALLGGLAAAAQRRVGLEGSGVGTGNGSAGKAGGEERTGNEDA